jgi:hypothetical protein
MDESQAAGLTLRPTALLPRVWSGLDPSEPAYAHLAGIPAGQMALLLGNGSPRSVVNKVGSIYHRAGATGALPSTDKLLRGFTSGRGTNDMIMGVKAGPHDYPSSYAPGYAYGQEPMAMGEAASTVGGLLDAALYSEPLNVQAKYSGILPGSWGSFLIDKWAGRALKRPAGKGVAPNRFVGRRLFR